MGRVGGKREQGTGAAAQNQFVEVRFVNGETAFAEQTDSLRVAIHAENMMTDGCQATASDQADVATSYDTHSHEFTLR